jgi:hypothetical protein
MIRAEVVTQSEMQCTSSTTNDPSDRRIDGRNSVRN